MNLAIAAHGAHIPSTALRKKLIFIAGTELMTRPKKI